VEPSSTDDPRRKGALPIADSCSAAQDTNISNAQVKGRRLAELEATLSQTLGPLRRLVPWRIGSVIRGGEYG
jgi:hypothetical protein